MRKLVSLFFAFVLVCGVCFSAPIEVSAASASDLTFVLNSDKKSYSVSKCKETAKGEITIPKTYKNLPVTVIGDSAFYNCTSLTSVKIPNTVITIDNCAFMYCFGLKSIVIPDSVKTMNDLVFHSCNNLNSVSFGKGLKKIGGNAFFACEGLTSIVIPDNVTSLGQAAFAYCSNLESVKIGSGITQMGVGAFYFCTKLSKVLLGDGISVIGESAFLGCENLKSVIVPGSVKTIGAQALGYSNSSVKTKGFVINGKSGSVAQNYAKENGFTFKVTSSVKSLSTPKVKIENTAKGIKLLWSAVANADEYIIYRRTYDTSTKKYSKWSILKTAYQFTNYTDTKTKLGVTYSYAVRAVSGTVQSKYEATKGLKYNSIPIVKVANASNGIKVSWTTVANATGYTVYSASYNAKTKKWSGWTNRGTASANKTSWTDTKAKSGIFYKYTVRACNGKNFKSNYKASENMLFLAQPTVKIANATTGIKVNWSKTSGSTGYRVYRSELVNNNYWSSWKVMGTAKSTASSWVDRNVKNSVQYRYTVRSVRGDYMSTYKASDSLIYLETPNVEIANCSNGVKVSWTTISTTDQEYLIYRSVYNESLQNWSKWSVVSSGYIFGDTPKCWVDENVMSGAKYRYTVRIVSGSAKSAYKVSNQLICLTEPMVSVCVDSTTIKVSWEKTAGAESYILYRSDFNEKTQTWSEWACVAEPDSEITSWSDANVSEGSTYKYGVCAVNGANKSTFKEDITITYSIESKN